MQRINSAAKLAEAAYSHLRSISSCVWTCDARVHGGRRANLASFVTTHMEPEAQARGPPARQAVSGLHVRSKLA